MCDTMREEKTHAYPLEERTAKFAEQVIAFCKSIPSHLLTTSMISQLIRSSSSQAANYYEATEAESPKDFYHKVGIARKEAKETQLWLRLIAAVHEPSRPRARELWKEAHELTLIFASIYRKKQNK